MSRLKLGVSACLLGELTRYDGENKLDDNVRALVAGLDVVAVCPEVEAGLPTPREPMQLVQVGQSVRLLGVSSRQDFTSALEALISRRLQAITALALDGFVLKNRSPSCGLAGVPIFATSGEPIITGSGLFAAALTRAFPGMPIVEAEELQVPRSRATFLAAAAAYHAAREAAT